MEMIETLRAKKTLTLDFSKLKTYAIRLVVSKNLVGFLGLTTFFLFEDVFYYPPFFLKIYANFHGK